MNAPQAPFERAGKHIAITLGLARAVFTTRHGGVSEPPYATLNLGRFTDDEPAAVAANYDTLGMSLGVTAARIAQARQVHGARVLRVRAATAPGALEDADGLATATAGLPVLVLTADCLPIAIAGGTAVAMLHAGWPGLAAGTLAEGVRAVRELGATGPLTAAIGPGAGACCYEVGDDLRERFGTSEPTLDLKAIAAAQLREAGVTEVHDAQACTICDERFFSHRREHGVTGRQAGVAWLT